jgi:hypothetical protein
MNNILCFSIAEKVGLLMERTVTTETDTERLTAASEGGVLARTGGPQSDPDRATSIQLITAAAAANDPGWTIVRRTGGGALHPRRKALGTFPRRQPLPQHGVSGIRPAGRRQKRPPPPVRTRIQRSAASPPR